MKEIWIARDSDEELGLFFGSKPINEKGIWKLCDNYNDYYAQIPEYLFPEVKVETCHKVTINID